MSGNGLGTGFMYLIIVQILFFIVTIGIIIWFVRNTKSDKDPKEILNNRLASGEITKKVYNQLLRTITNSEVKTKWKN